jgi:hypothetical protein
MGGSPARGRLGDVMCFKRASHAFTKAARGRDLEIRTTEWLIRSR